MRITTPAEVMAVRCYLGLTRKELSDLTGDTESFVRGIENTKAVNIPGHIVDRLMDLQVVRSEMIRRWEPDPPHYTIVSFGSEEIFKDFALEWDALAPTASFHRSVCESLLRHSREDYEAGLLVHFNPNLFSDSHYGKQDTDQNRRLWARAWAKNYNVIGQ